ncbi:alpha 1,2 mannosyltransferase [Exophiala xenobiotica]|nr:alpha 1,2 mannosyltransferase [Exophiala xenobiotica]
MALLKWTWAQDDDGLVDPHTIYYALRLVMFVLSFVLEDWAVHDLVRSPRHRRDAVVLVCSSYVTWTFQTHTFSNAVETILVLWSLVVIERIVGENKRSAIASPFCLLALVLSGTFWTLVAIVLDTAYYSDAAATRSFRALYDHVRHAPVITPLNNVLYNTQTSNLAQHGLHPHYQHFLINLPQLLGPAIILLVASAYPFNLRILKATLSNARLASATTGTLLLSLFPHQEPRFLLPTIPLFLSCIRLPTSTIWRRTFWASWILFNTALAILMGIYHQGGIIATQLAIPSLLAQCITHTQSRTHNIEVFWWKTYPPPNFLLGTEPRHPLTNSSLNISTVPLMGFPQSELVFMLMQHMPTCDPSLIERLILHKEKTDVFVVAPLAAWRLEATEPPSSNFSFSVAFNIPPAELIMTNIFTYRQHINLDDMDFGDDGVLPTLQRVIGRRGLGVWKVDRICGPVEYVDKHTGERVVPNKVLEQEGEGDANIQEERQMPSSTDSVAGKDAVPTITTTLASHLHTSAEVS